jgi:hypothetical protein
MDPQPRCLYCGQTTHRALECPRVKAFEFFQNGTTIRRVEFHAADNGALLDRIEALINLVKRSQAELATMKLKFWRQSEDTTIESR